LRFPYFRRSGDLDLHALAELGRDDALTFSFGARTGFERSLDRALELELGVSRLRRESLLRRRTSAVDASLTPLVSRLQLGVIDGNGLAASVSLLATELTEFAEVRLSGLDAVIESSDGLPSDGVCGEAHELDGMGSAAN